MSTVGYGDVNPTNIYERIFLIFVMCFGVIAFSFFAGSLSSIMQSYDDRAVNAKEDLMRLKDIKEKYGLDKELFLRVRQGFFAKKNEV